MTLLEHMVVALLGGILGSLMVSSLYLRDIVRALEKRRP